MSAKRVGSSFLLILEIALSDFSEVPCLLKGGILREQNRRLHAEYSKRHLCVPLNFHKQLQNPKEGRPYSFGSWIGEVINYMSEENINSNEYRVKLLGQLATIFTALQTQLYLTFYIKEIEFLSREST